MRRRSSFIDSPWPRRWAACSRSSHAAGAFVTIVIGEVLWGIAIGWLMLRLRRWVRDPRIEILLSVLTPFMAYWPPQYLGGSGVLATVTTGLYISWNGLRLISAATRLQGIFFWDFLIYVIDGMVFLLTGLQARTLFAGVKAHPAAELVVSAVVVSAVRHRHSIHLDVSGNLSSALAHSLASRAGIRRRPGNGRSCLHSPASVESFRSRRRSRFRSRPMTAHPSHIATWSFS